MVTFNTSNLMYGIGLDSLFNRLEIASQANSSNSYPPYNIRKTDDEHFTIEANAQNWISTFKEIVKL